MLGDLEEIPISQNITGCSDKKEEENLENVNADMDLKSSDEDDEPIVVTKTKKKLHRSILESDSEDEFPAKRSEKETEEKIGLEEDEELDKEDTHASKTDEVKDHANNTSEEVNPPIKFNDDLFDAEMESDGEEKDKDSKHDSENSENENQDESQSREEGQSEDEDDGFTPEMSASLKKRLAKGAAKAPREQRKASAQLRKQQAMEIHSETQRLVRESQVQLPYHQPQKADLSVFLARTKQKHEQLGLASRLKWKEIPDPSKLAAKQSAIIQKVTSEQETSKVEIKQSDDEIRAPQANNHSEEKVLTDINEDELPELTIETVSGKSCTKSSCGTIYAKSRTVDLDAVGSKLKEVVEVQQESCKPKVIELEGKVDDKNSEKQEISLFIGPEKEAEKYATEMENKSAKCSDKKPEQDSGYLTTPLHSSEEENSGDSKKLPNKSEMSVEPSTQNKTSSLKSKLKAKLNQLKLPELSLPKLGKCDFVDLDEEDPQVKEQGKNSEIEELVQRFVNHNKPKAKRARDLQISTVHKELEGDRQELKLDTFTYRVSGEEEEAELNFTAAAAKPGAKLEALKLKLHEKIRVRRQEARQERIRLHEIDNEEGYEECRMEEDPLDLEAELTDQTDTDGEDDDEEGEDFDEEEELDEEEYGANEREIKNNPFVDAEADESDDDDYVPEESLHLELESDGDSADNEDGDEKEDCGRQFLEKARQKTKSLAVFDEDANTESPTMSQKSNLSEVTDVSERPFIQLSGEKNKELTSEDTMCLEPADPMRDESTLASDRTLYDETNTSLASVDCSMELIGTLLPAGQRTGHKKHHSGATLERTITPELFTPSTKGSMAGANYSALSRSSSKFSSDLCLPIEDTQDLLRRSPSLPMAQSLSQSTPKVQSNGSQSNFHFVLEEDDTGSQMLDADGLLKVASSRDKHSRRQLLVESIIDSDDKTAQSSQADDELFNLCSGRFATQADNDKMTVAGIKPLSDNSQSSGVDELLGLCSGRFATQKPSAIPASGGFGALAEDSESGVLTTQGEMSELLGLCSGRFADKTAASTADNPPADKDQDSPIKIKKIKRKRVIVDDDEEQGDAKSEASFGMVEDDDGANTSDQEENLDSDEENVAPKFKGFTEKNKHGKILKDFVEDEAELSGSEYDSDEDLDLAEEDDILELEAGDADDVGPQEVLRDQVNRLHLKSVIDSDKREIRLLQEMYLPDGDLHSEGKGRMRRFRWANIDEDDTQQDMFKDSDGEEEEETEEEKQWRLERHQREKFLAEQASDQVESEDSQVLKLGKVVFKQQTANSTTASQVSEKPKAAKTVVEKAVPAPASGVFKVPKLGSFLSKGSDELARIAERNKPVSTNVGAPRHSRNFVFTSKSPESDEKRPDKKPQVKRSISVTSGSPEKAAKRPKLERSNTLPPKSIFHHM